LLVAERCGGGKAEEGKAGEAGADEVGTTIAKGRDPAVFAGAFAACAVVVVAAPLL
jgi:hypothetical protein